jgi:hypothetical protein
MRTHRQKRTSSCGIHLACEKTCNDNEVPIEQDLILTRINLTR